MRSVDAIREDLAALTWTRDHAGSGDLYRKEAVYRLADDVPHLLDEREHAEDLIGDLLDRAQDAEARAAGLQRQVDERDEQLAALREHTLASNPALRTLHSHAVAYLDAVAALQEASGAPLSTTLAWLIKSGYLVRSDSAAALGSVVPDTTDEAQQRMGEQT